MHKDDDFSVIKGGLLVLLPGDFSICINNSRKARLAYTSCWEKWEGQPLYWRSCFPVFHSAQLCLCVTC